ncbi:uncharacterized protein O3C94_016355 [Discoglossus pictus]
MEANHESFLYKDGTGDQGLLVEQPEHIIAEAGGSVTMNCNFDAGSKHFSVIWSIGCSNRTPFNTESCYKNRVITQQQQITIVNLTENDSGTYCCHVELYNRRRGVGNGTRLEVIRRPSQIQTGSSGKDLFIHHVVIGVESSIIIILLVVLIAYYLRGTCKTQKKDNSDQGQDTGLHYASISTRTFPQHQRTRHMEDRITYASLKTQNLP